MSVELPENGSFWDYAEELIRTSRISLDRPKGTEHPRFPEVVYPFDYGFLEDTKAMDGGGIDIWVGSLGLGGGISGTICTLDMLKRDSEVKFLIGCTEEDMAIMETFHNRGPMRGLVIRRR